MKVQRFKIRLKNRLRAGLV